MAKHIIHSLVLDDGEDHVYTYMGKTSQEQHCLNPFFRPIEPKTVSS